MTVSTGSRGLEGHGVAGSFSSGTGVRASAREDVPSSVSESVFAPVLLDLSETPDFKDASQVSGTSPHLHKLIKIVTRKRREQRLFGKLNEERCNLCWTYLGMLVSLACGSRALRSHETLDTLVIRLGRQCL